MSEIAEVRSPPRVQASTRALGYALAVLPLALVLVLRAGVADLDRDGQATQALYLLDAYAHGNWVLPQAHGTEPSPIPPLHVWLGLICSAILGGVSETSCRAPSILAAFLLTLLVFRIGLERWSLEAGLVAAWLLTASHCVLRAATSARPDMLLCLLATLALWALQRAELGRARGRASLFWPAVSLCLLSAGPLTAALLVVAALLICASAERRPSVMAMLASRWSLCLALPAVWGGLAYGVGGSPFVTEVALAGVWGRGPTGSAAYDALSRGWIGVFPWLVLGALVLTHLRCDATRSRRVALVLRGVVFAACVVAGSLVGAELPLPLWPPASLASAGLLLGGRRGETHTRGPAFALGVAAVALCLAFSVWRGPAVGASGAAGLRAFARRALEERRPGEQIRIREGVRSSFFFYMGQNDPPLTLREVEAYDRCSSGTGRSLLISHASDVEALDRRWPGRFRHLMDGASRAQVGGLVLVEDTASSRLPAQTR